MMPPLSSRTARDDAQYLKEETGVPADSTIAAHCIDRDFGTSRWQLSINGTRNCCGAGGGLWPIATDFALQPNVRFQGVRSTGQCNTACSLSAGVWKPKV